MVNYILMLPAMVSFFVTLFLIPIWINKAKGINLVWDDVNKKKSPKVAGSGGIIVILGFVMGLLLFIALRVFYFGTKEYLIEILALLSVVLILGCVGLVDDLLGWRRGGLRRRTRILLTFFAAIPLMAINAGQDKVQNFYPTCSFLKLYKEIE